MTLKVMTTMQIQANGHADVLQTTRLHVGHLTRNVSEGHIKEIFSTFGTLKSVELSIDKVIPRGPGDAAQMRMRCMRRSFSFMVVQSVRLKASSSQLTLMLQ